MKRRMTVGLLALLLVLSLTVTAFAAADDSGAKLSYVTDPNGYLTAQEASELNAMAKEISRRQGFSTYIIIVDDFRPYSQYAEIFDCSTYLYDSYNLGWGPDRDGVVLMLSMNERDYALNFNGDRSKAIFTDRRQDAMEDAFLGYFGNNDYYGGFKEYLRRCDDYLTRGEPEEKSGGIGALAAIPGAIIAAITGSAVSSPMKSAHRQTNANYYVDGRLTLTRRVDHFVNRTVTRQRKQTQTRSSSGSISHSSGSHSGRSGKF